MDINSTPRRHHHRRFHRLASPWANASPPPRRCRHPRPPPRNARTARQAIAPPPSPLIASPATSPARIPSPTPCEVMAQFGKVDILSTTPAAPAPAFRNHHDQMWQDDFDLKSSPHPPHRLVWPQMRERNGAASSTFSHRAKAPRGGSMLHHLRAAGLALSKALAARVRRTTSCQRPAGRPDHFDQIARRHKASGDKHPLEEMIAKAPDGAVAAWAPRRNLPMSPASWPRKSRLRHRTGINVDGGASPVW